MPLDPALASRILAAVEQGFDAQVETTRTMMAFPSTRGNEHTCQDWVFSQLRDRGYAMDRFEMDADAISRHPGAGAIDDKHSMAPIVVGIHRPRAETGRSLILQSHVDVVPSGPADMWTHPPFAPTVEGDWLYGRGGADMKAGGVANLAALDALRALGLQPAATVYVQSVVEEESTGNGALMTHLRGYRADAVLIPEPEEEMLVRANTGVLWFQVEVRGRPGHVREMGAGANAIDAAWRVVGALRGLEAEWKAEHAKHKHFEDEPDAINLNVGKIEGGDWASSVPAWCRIDFRISIYPGISAGEAQAQIQACIDAFSRADGFLSNNPPSVTFNGFLAEGYVQDEGTEAEAILAAAHQGATGEALKSFMTAGYLDARVHALYDQVPTLCYGPKSKDIHGVDERVSLASLKRITGAMALFVAEWCGVEPLEG